MTTPVRPTALRVDRIGYLVPRQSFIGTVQSVYARACNVASDELLLTIVAPAIADGPTALVLAGDRVVDLRTCFRVRERVVRCGDRVVSPGADVDLTHAASWQPDAGPVIADTAQLAANLHVAATRLAIRIEHGASVIHREGRAACARIEQACGHCDVERALLDALPLIGWGEGLTPAGDDFLVGVLAGLHALAMVSTQRTAFLTRFSDGVVAHRHRTTAIAAHCLNLAAGSHFTADVHRLRGAVLASNDIAEVAQLADDALAVGATSGADRVAGLLAGISAWRPVFAP